MRKTVIYQLISGVAFSVATAPAVAGPIFNFTYTAVSYTHLDVYKRQVSQKLLRQPPRQVHAVGEAHQQAHQHRHAEMPFAPVSYTHLDVYKRQGHGSPPDRTARPAARWD